MNANVGPNVKEDMIASVSELTTSSHFLSRTCIENKLRTRRKEGECEDSNKKDGGCEDTKHEGHGLDAQFHGESE